MAELDNISAAIAAGTALSAEVDIGTKSLVGVYIPATWTTASITFQASPDGSNWYEVYTIAGTAYTISSLTGGTLAYFVAVDPTALRGMVALKVRSGTQAAPVNQVSLVTLQLMTRLAV